jgi:hypothetical protein
MDIEKLKALALAARDERVWPFNEIAFQKAANPAAVLELIAEVERLRAAIPQRKVKPVATKVGVRKANRGHHCPVCLTRINSGERYMYDRIPGSERLTPFPMHLACHAAAIEKEKA